MVLLLLTPNIDTFGMITQANGDGGDSFQREGMVMVAAHLLANVNQISAEELASLESRYEAIIHTLQVGECCSFRRHKDVSKWYGQPDRMSRDQLTSNIVSMGLNHSDKLLPTFLWHVSRFGFTTNTRDNFVDETARPKLPDFCGPSILGSYIRAFNAKLLKPLLYLTDVELLINSVLIKRQAKKDASKLDINSHLCLLIQSQLTLPTFVSKLATRILASMPLCPPPSYTNGQMLSDFGPQTALDLYFDKNQSGGAPLINELFRPVLKDILK